MTIIHEQGQRRRNWARLLFAANRDEGLTPRSLSEPNVRITTDLQGSFDVDQKQEPDVKS